MSTDEGDEQLPKSMRHRQILDLAEEDPDASIDELASRVPSATADLVEHVFDRHGDPATDDETSTETKKDMSSTDKPTSSDDDSDTGTEPADSHSNGEETDQKQTTKETESAVPSNAGTDGYPSLSELSEKHHELLSVVAAHPSATQQTIAEHVDVTSATVSRWANNIEGFEWGNRETFIDAVFDDPPSSEMDRDSTPTAETAASETSHTDSVASTVDDDTTKMTAESTLNRLEERITDLEESQTESAGTDSVFEDPDLVHKIVHACMESERIDESDEIRILEEVLE